MSPVQSAVSEHVRELRRMVMKRSAEEESADRKRQRQYRDRARCVRAHIQPYEADVVHSERRAKHGLDVSELATPQEEAEPVTVAAPEQPIGAGTVGYRLLQQMGWTAGTGLGRKSQGPVDPIAVTQRKGREGLGAETSRPQQR